MLTWDDASQSMKINVQRVAEIVLIKQHRQHSATFLVWLHLLMYVHHISVGKSIARILSFQSYPCSALHCVEQSVWSELCLCQTAEVNHCPPYSAGTSVRKSDTQSQTQTCSSYSWRNAPRATNNRLVCRISDELLTHVCGLLPQSRAVASRRFQESWDSDPSCYLLFFG